MAKLEFNDLRFVEEKERVKVFFLRQYHFYIGKEDLAKIGDYKIQENSIEFSVSEKSARNKFHFLLDNGFGNLTNILTGKRTIYIHKNSGIPLMGSNEFGIVDRGTSCIEVKPLTGCNLNCIFCAVNEGDNNKIYDFVVEKDYLVQEFKRVSAIKQNPVEAHINAQGEPLLYAPLVDLVHDLHRIKEVKVISIDTNGSLLTEKLIDQLSEAGMSRLNISLNALDPKLSNKLSGCPYNLQHVLRMIDYAQGKIDVLLAPLIIPGMNESEIAPLLELAQKLESRWPKIGFQNFLSYKRGRNPVKQRSFEEFYSLLERYEKKHNIKLRFSLAEDFKILMDNAPAKPFKKGDQVKATIIAHGRYASEKLAVAKDRVITVKTDEKIGKNIKVKITRSKHNIFYAGLAK
ncbi:MAG: radical SAM protein [archaeon]